MLKAGSACIEITPPLGTRMPGLFHERRAETIHDPLFVKSFVLEQEGDAVAVSVCDLIGVKRKYLDQAKSRIREMIGLEPAHVLICCTHTHTGAETGDDEYTSDVGEKITESVRIAWEEREPARAGWGSVDEDRVVFNRRYRMADGSIRTNPGVGNTQVVEPVGVIDPEIGVLCVQSRDGNIIGLLGNYALHYVGGGDHERAISADYFGYFSELIQRLFGERFVAALSNGPCGDVNNHDVIGGARHANDRYQHTERVAALVAAGAFWTLSDMDLIDEVSMSAVMEEVLLSRKPAPTEVDRERAGKIEEVESATMEDRAFARRIERIEDTPETVSTWVQAMRIGDLALVGIPGELFVDLGLAIKARSPFGQTMVLELANDSVGYIPGEMAFAEGGYEPEASLFRPGVGEQVVEAAVRLLERLLKRTKVSTDRQ